MLRVIQEFKFIISLLIFIFVKFGVNCQNSTWKRIPWAGNDIGVGAEGSVYIIDTNGSLWHWRGYD